MSKGKGMAMKARQHDDVPRIKSSSLKYALYRAGVNRWYKKALVPFREVAEKSVADHLRCALAFADYKDKSTINTGTAIDAIEFKRGDGVFVAGEPVQKSVKEKKMKR